MWDFLKFLRNFSMANGSDIDHDILVEIAKLLTEFDDFFAFSLVCHSWRLAAVQESFRFNSFIRIPWLMYAPPAAGAAKGNSRNRRVFLDLPTGKTHPIVLPDHHIIHGRRSCFSSKGWLITIAQDTTMRLFHPFTRAEMKLPHVKTIKNWKNYEIDSMYPHFIKKCVLSSCPLLSGSDYTLMVIFGERRQLAYTKAGDKSWNTVRTLHTGFFDVIYFKHNFYAVNSLGEIMVLRGNDPMTMEQKIAVRPLIRYKLIENTLENLYMVEWAESLLVIKRKGVYQKGTYKSSKFQVFEVDLMKNSWTEVKSLGGGALFLGRNSSISVGDSTVLSNCIYFTDDCLVSQVNWLREEGEDVGIYKMSDGRIERYFEGNWYMGAHPPLWIERSF